MPLLGEYLPSTAEWAREQAEEFEASGGREAGTHRGVPIVVITTVGAKTGGLRKTALMRVEHDGQYLVVASHGGAPTAPAWYWNLRHTPRAELQDRDARQDYVARELDGPEREQWWQRALEVWPDYAEYQKRTNRLIALVLLEPAS